MMPQKLKLKLLSVYSYTFIFLIIFGSVSCNGQTKTEDIQVVNTLVQKDSLVTFLTYGELAPDNYLDDENPITEKYGFKMKRESDCEVSPDILSKVHKNNQLALDFMRNKYGENWRTKFTKDTGYKLVIPLD